MKKTIFLIAVFLCFSVFAEERNFCSDSDNLAITAIDSLNAKLSKIKISQIGKVTISEDSNQLFGGYWITRHQACVTIISNADSCDTGRVIYSKHYHRLIEDANLHLNEALILSEFDFNHMGDVQVFESIGSIIGQSNITSFMLAVSTLHN